MTKAPLNKNKVKTLITYLERLKLGKDYTVILELTCNFAPCVSPNTADKKPFSDGAAKGRKFHPFDSEGNKIRLPSDEFIGQLNERIALITDSIRAKGVLVVNLAPLPRYQGPCCVVQSHGLQGGDSPGTFNILLRDVGVYMGRSSLLNQSAQLVISPMDIVSPSAFLHSQTSKDNVQPKWSS